MTAAARGNSITARDFRSRTPEGCGVVGVYGHPDAARIAALALHALQHRGQETAGVAVFDGERIRTLKGEGFVAEVLTPEALASLPGSVAIGHVRYSTTGGSVATNAQPLTGNYRGGALAVAHNGNLTNAEELAKALEANGAIFQSTSDSELLIHLVAQNRDPDFGSALAEGLRRLRGAFSMLVLHGEELWAVKDAHGFRPLCLGRVGDGWIVASESCALDIVGATFLRELLPGEGVRFSGGEPEKSQVLPPAEPGAFCVFELIYFARPDSVIANKNVYEYRVRLGEELAAEQPADADVVISVPDSSNAAAIGYARALGIPLEMGLVRSHYIGRTFIQPGQDKREHGARLKYNPVRHVLAGRRVAVLDDSVVRGTTARQIMRMLREAGAREVHFRVSAPPWRHPCYYGIDTPHGEHLIANRMAPEEMRRYLEVDSLGFISLDGLSRAMPKTIRYCNACFTGRYVAGRPRQAHDSGTCG